MGTSSGIGKLYLVGLGPGARQHLTPAALVAMAECDVVVGYRPYVEQVRDLLDGKELVAMELTQEMERAAIAVDLASSGRRVAVVSSGDIGVYGGFVSIVALRFTGQHASRKYIQMRLMLLSENI